jgi:hypothetical protein
MPQNKVRIEVRYGYMVKSYGYIEKLYGYNPKTYGYIAGTGLEYACKQKKSQKKYPDVDPEQKDYMEC